MDGEAMLYAYTLFDCLFVLSSNSECKCMVPFLPSSSSCESISSSYLFSGSNPFSFGNVRAQIPVNVWLFTVNVLAIDLLFRLFGLFLIKMGERLAYVFLF